MNELVIDEKFLNAIDKSIDSLIEMLMAIKNDMMSKDKSFFVRYKAFSTILPLLKQIESFMESHKDTFQLGFLLNQSVLMNNGAIEKGWGEIESKENPFFVNEGDREHERSDSLSAEDVINSMKEMKTALDLLQSLKEFDAVKTKKVEH